MPWCRQPLGFEDVSGAEGGCGVPALDNEISGGSKARPHAFPWVVRLTGGCPRGLCGASLITTRHILTSFHCTYYSKKGPRPCDHSDGGWVVVGGARDAPRCAGPGHLRQQQPAQLLFHPGHRCRLHTIRLLQISSTRPTPSLPRETSPPMTLQWGF